MSKTYLAPPESLRASWKIKRDTRKRGYDEAQVLEQLRQREADSDAFIRPQRKWADMIVSFYFILLLTKKLKTLIYCSTLI